MDPNNMTEEQKREVMMKAAGQCNFLCLFIFTTAAFSCSVASTSWCAFADRDITLVPGTNVTEICMDLDTSSEAQCQSWVDNHGVGFYAWQSTVPVDQVVCLSYTQPIEGVGYVTIPTDTKFNTARVSAGIAAFFGLLCFMTLALASCCPLNGARMAGMSCYYFIATLFQGLAFLIFSSSACEKGFFAPFYQGTSLDGAVQSVTCSLARGGKLAVSATVLYFVCMCSVPAARPPDPVGGNPFGGDGQGGEAPPPAPAAEGENP